MRFPSRSPLARIAALLCAGFASAFCARPVLPLPDSITISVPYEIETLDPHSRDWAGSIAIASHFYEPLVSTDATMRLRPCLARAWETPDAVTWIFHLRPSVRFHSGRLLRAEDVVFSIDRLRTRPEMQLGNYAFDVTEAVALDPLTVRLRIRRPVTIFLAKLQYVLIVPAGSSDAGLSEAENGTGPYRLAEWRKGSQIRMQRFTGYWGMKPTLAAATFRLGRSPEESIADLRAGRSQLVQSNPLGLDTLGNDPSFSVRRRRSLFVSYLGFGFSEDNPFRNPLVREAVDLALDRSRMVSDLPTRAEVATQLVPSFVFGFDRGLAAPARDLARARSLLRDAGISGGFGVTLDSRRTMTGAAAVVRDSLREIGIRTSVRELPDASFFDRMRRHRSTLFLAHYACQTGDASEALDQLVHSPDAEKGLGRSNDGGYRNRELDLAIELAGQELAVSNRANLLRAAMAMTRAERPLIPLVIDEDAYALRSDYEWQPRDDGDIRAAEISRRTPPDR